MGLSGITNSRKVVFAAGWASASSSGGIGSWSTTGGRARSELHHSVNNPEIRLVEVLSRLVIGYERAHHSTGPFGFVEDHRDPRVMIEFVYNPSPPVKTRLLSRSGHTI